MKKVNLLFITIVITLISCKKDNNGNDNSNTAITGGSGVYVSAYINDGTGSSGKIIKNALPYDVKDGAKQIQANDVFVSGSDVYVAGGSFNDASVAWTPAYWKNGTIVTLPLPSNTKSGALYSIVISGTDVYSVGSVVDNNGAIIATYWKNNVPTLLASGSPTTSYGSGVYVSGTDVYIGGIVSNSGGNFVIRYWKNGNVVNLTDGTKDANIGDIFVNGADVYVCGSEKNNSNIWVAKYWKNGVVTNLSNGTKSTFANSIHVSDPSNIHICGTEGVLPLTGSGDRKAVYWKNGVQTNLTDGTKDAAGEAIIVNASDVYISGKEDKIIKYWKNGTANSLNTSIGITTSGKSTSIFVQ